MTFVKLPNGTWVQVARVSAVKPVRVVGDDTKHYVRIQHGDGEVEMLSVVSAEQAESAARDIVKLLLNPPPDMVLSSRPALPFAVPVPTSAKEK